MVAYNVFYNKKDRFSCIIMYKTDFTRTYGYPTHLAYNNSSYICMKNMNPRNVWAKVDILYVSWQIIEQLFFQIINHEILVAIVTIKRLIFHGYVAALYAY